MTTEDRHSQSYAELVWNTVKVLDLKRCKETVILDGIHSPYVNQILNP